LDVGEPKQIQISGDASAQVGKQPRSGEEELDDEDEDEREEVPVEEAAEEPDLLDLHVAAHDDEHGEHRRRVAQPWTVVRQ